MSSSHRSLQPIERDLPLWPAPNHRGMFILPDTGKRIWWTGRVAIGLRHALPQADAAAADPAPHGAPPRQP